MAELNHQERYQKYLTMRKGKVKKIGFISGSILLLALSTWMLLCNGNTNGKTDSSDYTTMKVQKRSIEQFVTATGIVKPKIGAEVKVGAQVSGVVVKLYVEIGSNVKKGDLLAEIESSGYNAKVKMAQAQKEIAETEKIYAELEFKRVLFLNQKGGMSQQQLENTQKLFELSSSRLAQAVADLDYAKLQLSYTKIYSPINGIVSSVTTQEGETVTASFTAPTFVTIIDFNRLEVWAYVDETDIGRIQNGEDVKFTVDTYPGEEFGGKVETIYPKAEIQNNVVNYITVINIGKKDGKIIRPEMTASVGISCGKKDNVLAIPKALVKKENGKTFVYTIKNGNQEKMPIETGISDKKYYEVISGLKENESVISSEITNDK
jgi:HlyD family secretion protein